MKKSFTTYLLFAFGIFSWWLLAFMPKAASPPPSFNELNKKQEILSTSLTTLKREELLKALQGDIQLMSRLIADWDIDAQVLQLAGIHNIRRLDRYAFLRSQLLGRQLIEEKGPKRSSKYLPQTYVAASFLLALTDAERIIALPKGLRNHRALFPKELTDKIACDFDRFQTERLYLNKPELAFVADYSDPILINALQLQDIPLCTIKNLDSISDIQNAIKKVGQLIHCPSESELLSLFIEAALCSIDNRIIALSKPEPQQSVLLVTYFHQYMLPSSNSLTGQLLARTNLKLALPPCENVRWSSPISQEQIIKADPYHLIIATLEKEKLLAMLSRDPAFCSLNAVREHHVTFVDSAVQEFPAQYIVLAYFDIYQALSK